MEIRGPTYNLIHFIKKNIYLNIINERYSYFTPIIFCCIICLQTLKTRILC